MSERRDVAVQVDPPPVPEERGPADCLVGGAEQLLWTCAIAWSTLNVGTIMAYVAGVAVAVGCTLLAVCWFQHPPFVFSVLLSGGTLVSAVVLNTVPMDRLQNRSTHAQAMTLLVVVFACVFAHVAYATWSIVQAPPHASTWEQTCAAACCSDTELYYIVLIAAGASLLRLYETLAPQTHDDDNTMSTAHRSLAAVLMVGLAVLAFTLQCFATFGKFGTQTAALVPLPVCFLCLVGIVLESVRATNPATLLSMWSAFVKATMLALCVCSPVAAANLQLLDRAQTALCVASMTCAVLSYLCIVKLLATTPHNYTPTQRMEWMF